MTEEPIEHHVELEGRNVVCQKRKRMIMPEVKDTQGDRLPYEQTEYSFDRKTWHTTMIEAYKQAQVDDKLMFVGESKGVAGEFEAFMLGLMQEVQGLEPGESLRVIRDQTEVLVVKEQAVLATRASTLSEIDLRVEGPSD